MARRAAPALVLTLSLALHAALALGFLRAGGRERAREPQAALRSFAPAVLARVAATHHAIARREARAALVSAARASLREGHLELGAFLLQTSRLDAEERGLELDLALAEARYAEHLAALRAALAGADIAHAVPTVFGRLRYHGRPGGLMASALIDGGGSCEQLSQLIAAAVYDAGRPQEIALRYYGGVMADGASHITPVALHETAEHDLMSGVAAAPGGVRFAAEELVEVYARAHGLAPPLAPAAQNAAPRSPATPSSSAASAVSAAPAASLASLASTASAASAASAGAPQSSAPPPRPTLAAGLPRNTDRYPGTLPLYAARAIREPSDDATLLGNVADSDEQAKNCAYLLRTAMLSPPSLDIELPATAHHGAGLIAVEPRRAPTPQRLEREAVILRAAETMASRDDVDPVDRVMAWACLAALGDLASVDFALAGEHRLADESVRVHRRGREEGKKALAALVWSGPEGARAAQKLSVEYGGRSWVLLALEGGDRVVLDLASRDTRESWGRISAFSALVVSPLTRAPSITVIATLPLADQVEVMHEVFHAHDHMRPWASSFDLDDTPGADPGVARFLLRYRVFRGLAWRLWEGQRPIAETLAALTHEARAEGLDPAWEAALLEYFARNTLGLHSQRAGGHGVIGVLREAAETNRHPSLEPLRRRLAYLEAQATLDGKTLADAWRVE